MANQSVLVADADLSLTITRAFDAPREAVFEAWIDPRQIASWLGPRGVRMECTEMQPWPGGSFRMVARDAAGNQNIVGGVFKEVTSPARLVFTWAWENRADTAGDTLVTVTFVAIGTRTEVTLRHEGFPTEDFRSRHQNGWNASFDNLAEILAGHVVVRGGDGALCA
ncbi:MAG TPA: SRPBCC domain-containing protein [Acetobacteraceae bacterium]